jgi:glycosyltransferase involved in cell wall biosynthesis
MATMSRSPVVSVLMITYNQAPYVARAIEGVLCQTLDEPFELIIGDDCSTDATRDIVESYARRHPKIVRVLAPVANVGMNENLRRVTLAASAPYVAFCEGDDVWHYSDKLLRQLSLFRLNPDFGMVYSDYDRGAQVFGYWRLLRGVIKLSGVPPARGDAFEDLLDSIQVHLSTMMCRAQLVRQYFNSELYDPQLRLGDVPLLLYCAASAQVGYLPVSTSIYRSTPGSATNRSRRDLLRIVQDHVIVVKRFEDKFGSELRRRQARQDALNAMVAKLAYAARDRAMYATVAPQEFRAHLRALLMRIPPLFSMYMWWVASRQKVNFWRGSEEASWLK